MNQIKFIDRPLQSRYHSAGLSSTRLETNALADSTYIVRAGVAQRRGYYRKASALPCNFGRCLN